MGFVLQLLPEVILGVVACVLFLGSTFKPGRALWGAVALVGLAAAGGAPYYVSSPVPSLEEPAQEAAMKSFLLSVFSSRLLLLGFSYLYGVAGTTNVPAILDTLTEGRAAAGRAAQAAGELTQAPKGAGWRGLSLVALVMIV